LNYSLDRFRSEKNFRNFTAICYLNVSTEWDDVTSDDIAPKVTHCGDSNINSNSSCSDTGANLGGQQNSWHLETEGGALRCFIGANESDSTGATAKEIMDIAPEGGRVVLFESRELLHAVQPTKRSRLALTAWIFSDAILADDEISMTCVDIKEGGK
jgi:hypothetical protein